jgi:hypothetical protein
LKPSGRARGFLAAIVVALVCCHAYLLLLGLASRNVWPLAIVGVGLLTLASGWLDPPFSTASILDVGRVLGWSRRTSGIAGRAVVLLAILLFISGATLFL